MSMQGKVVVVTGSERRHRARDGRRPGRPGGDHGARLPQPGQGGGGGPGDHDSAPGTTTSTSCRSTWPTWPRCARRPTDILTRWDRLDVLVNNAGGTWSDAPGDGAGLRVHVRRQPPRPLLPDEPAAAPAPGQRAVPRHQPDLGRPPCGTARHALRRPPERAALRGDGGLLPLQAGQRALHPPAGEAARRRTSTSPSTPPIPARSAAASAWTATCTGHGLRHAARPALRDQPQARRQDVAPPGHVPDVAGKTGMYWVRSKPGHMSRQARDDAAAAAPVGRERAAARLRRLRRRLSRHDRDSRRRSGITGHHPPRPDGGPEHDPAHDHQ